jgi:hypothetical protein
VDDGGDTINGVFAKTLIAPKQQEAIPEGTASCCFMVR